MHLQLTARAKTEGVSLNSLVLAFIAEGLGRRHAARSLIGISRYSGVTADSLLVHAANGNGA